MTAKAEFVFLEDEVTFLDVVAPNVDSVTVHEIEVKWQENSFCHSSSEKMEALNKRSFQHKALPIKRTPKQLTATAKSRRFSALQCAIQLLSIYYRHSPGLNKCKFGFIKKGDL